MCIGGGGSAPPPPPPPPDYSPQINTAKTDMRDYNKRLADEYNQSVDAFNKSISQYNPILEDGGASTIDPYAAAFGIQGEFQTGLENNFLGGSDGFQMEDLSDQSQKDALQRQIQAARSSMDFLDSLDFDQNVPEFRTHDSGSGWSASVYDTPTLNRPDYSIVEDYRKKYRDALTQLNTVNQQRIAEEGRVNDFRSGLLNDLSEADVGLTQMSIADIQDMDRIERELARGQNRMDNFSSTIFDQMYPEGFTEVSSSRDDIAARLSGLRDERTAEEKRISDFEAGILNFVDSGLVDLEGLDIRNLAELEELQKGIEGRERDMGRFSSLLQTDFLDESRELSDLGIDIESLLRDRSREESRIAGDVRSYLTQAKGINDAARGGNPFSMEALNAISDRIGGLRSDITGYDSLLDTDFSGSLGHLDTAQTRLDEVLGERKTSIDDLLSRATAANVGLEDIPLSDEEALRSVIAANRGVAGDLSAFTGGRVGDIGNVISQNVQAVDARLSDLDKRRSELETQAQALRDELRNANLRTSSDLDDPQSRVDTLQTQIELFNAERAQDELQQMMELLGSRRSQISSDEAEAARREKLARESIAETLVGGIAQFEDLGLQQPLTPEQYLLLLQSQDEEEEPLSTSANPFALNTGAL